MLSMDAMRLEVSTLTETREARTEQRIWHNAEENEAILSWISNLSFEEKQADILSKRHPGTGEWLLQQDTFKGWRNGVHDEPSTLWCPGIRKLLSTSSTTVLTDCVPAGAGKSVMTYVYYDTKYPLSQTCNKLITGRSVVIDHLQTVFPKRVSVSYIYCDYKDLKNQTTINLIWSLVKQMVLQQEVMPQEVKTLYSNYKNRQSSLSLEDLSRLLSSLSNSFRRSFILVDALDEHLINNDEENSMQLTLLNVLLTLPQQRNGSKGYTLFFTSRENGLIQERLDGCTRIDIYATDADITSYVRSRICDPAKFSFAKKVQKDANLGKLIVSGLVEKARGMLVIVFLIKSDSDIFANRFSRFLIPHLHLDLLGYQTNVRDVRKALESLPTKLNETYIGAMTRIQGQVQEHSKLALSALSWISNALRPLNLDELQHALAVQLGDQSLDEEALVDESLIISVSAGLITLDTESGTIRLVHFTVEEFFRETKTKWFPDADRHIAKICLTYLSFDAFEIGRCLPNQELYARLRENCFLGYAASNWGHHAHRAEDHTVDEHALEDLALYFLRNDHKVSCSNQIMQILGNRPKGYSSSASDQVSGLQLTAWFGLISITKRILSGGNMVDSKDSEGQTPLSWAAERGHEAVVKLLVDRDDVITDSKDVYGQTSLFWAAIEGHEVVVKLLVNRDDVIADSKDANKRTPLARAAREGHEAVVKLLVDRDNVIADSKDIWGKQPLSYAAQEGYEIVMKLLLDRDDVTADLKNIRGRTPLARAASRGHEAVVKLLVDRDDVVADSKDDVGDTPLSMATFYGHQTVVKLLEEKLKNTRVEE